VFCFPTDASRQTKQARVSETPSPKRKANTYVMSAASGHSVRMQHYIKQGTIPNCGLKCKGDATGADGSQNPPRAHTPELFGVGSGMGVVGSAFIMNTDGNGSPLERDFLSRGSFPPKLSREL
jgi:hypothetical protein